ncbi:MAG: hypothetical protein AMXMBFR13_29410 [Phycisphaerae bacterium]
MRTLLAATIAALLFTPPLTASAADAPAIWRIGAADRDYHDLAWDADVTSYPRRFPKDVDFRIGASDPKKDFSAIHPGPADDWAHGREHLFEIRFDMPEAPSGSYQLAIDLVDTHAALPPTLRVLVNGQKAEVTTERGTGDASMINPAMGKPRALRFAFNADVLKRAGNLLEIRNFKGSWALYDSVALLKLSDEPMPMKVTITPTIFFVERNGELRQEFILTASGLRPDRPATVEVRSGDKVLETVTLGQPTLGVASQAIHLTETAAPRELAVKLTSGDQVHTSSIAQKPQRKWRVYCAPATHTDIGYTDFQERVIALHNRNTDLALELARQYPLYHWNLESSWAAQVWFRDRPPARHEELLEAARQKRLGIESSYLNMLTGLCSGEELIRNLYYSARLHRESGVPFESHTLTDAPSHVWSLPTVLAGAGIKYLSVGVNQTRAPLFKKNIHHKSPFWWVGPDGSKILTWFTAGYSQAGHIGLKDGPDRMRGKIDSFLYWWDHREDYPYDAVLLHGAYTDNVLIGTDIAETITEYSKRYAYPKVVLCANNDFFEYIEEKFPDQIQTVTGCGGSWWEDGAASSAIETAMNRNAHKTAVAAETVWATAMATSRSADVPQEEFNRAWDSILLYDEHTWGAHNSITEPMSDFVTRQFAYKAAFASVAEDLTGRLLDRGLRQLAERIGPANGVLVFNPSGRPRTGPVRVDIPRSLAIADSQGPVPQQMVREDALSTVTVEFVARDVPAVGYRIYPLVTAEPARPAAQRFDGQVLENDFYRVVFDPATGGVKSLRDKQLGKELIDQSSPYKLGQMIYAAGGSPKFTAEVEVPRLDQVKFSSPVGEKIDAGASGPVFSSAKTSAKLPLFRQIELEVVLYEHEKRVDFVVRLNKEITFEKEAVYFAFPIAGAKPQFRYEIGGGNVRPNEDHFPGACRDWFAVQRWVTVNTADVGVAWSAVDTPLITLCDFTPGKWLDELPIANGTIYAYALNNYWFTNYKAGQDGRFTLRYSLTSDASMGPVAATLFGDSVHAPMRALHLNSGRPGTLPNALNRSFCQVEPASVEIMTVKPADDGKGLILRVRETGGKDTEARIQTAFGLNKASSCDLVERVQGDLPMENGRLSLKLGANAMATVRLE